MIEAELPSVLDRKRAAEAHAAVAAEARAAREQQINDLEEILVPTNGDPIFGDAAEARERSLVELLVERAKILDRLRRMLRVAEELGGERLDLQRVDADDAEPFVEQIVRQRVARGPETHDERVRAVIRPRVRAAHVQRIPAREQTVDLETVRHEQHVGQHVRLDLRDVDGLGLLVDAALHAVVADAVPGARAHRVVDHDQRERADAVALTLHDVHLGDLLFERAPRDLHAERIDLVRPVLAVAHALRARVRVAVVAIDAVIDLVERLPQPVASIRERESVAPAARRGAPFPNREAAAVFGLVRHESVEVPLLRLFEADPCCDRRAQLRIGLREMSETADLIEKCLDEFAIARARARAREDDGRALVGQKPRA